jgi:mevalonate pyrophosphate decarboxylase
VAVLNAEAKIHTSASGHKIADTSPFYEARIEYLEDKPQIVKDAIIEKDFKTLAHYSEMDTINMHSIMMTSTPPLFYLSPGSIDIIKKVRTWRADGLDVFYTFDAGANPHIIATERCADEVYKLLEENRYVNKLIKSAVGKGTRFVDTHLF